MQNKFTAKNIMSLKDILVQMNRDIKSVVLMEIYVYPNSDLASINFFGECAYINGELILLDGNPYDIDTEIFDYKMFNENTLIVRRINQTSIASMISSEHTR